MQLRGVFSTRRLQASGFVKGLHRILTCSVFAVMQTFFALSDEQRTCHETSREVERSLSPLCDNHFVVIWAVRNSEVNLGFSRLCLPMTSDAMHVYTFVFACCRSKVSNIVWSSCESTTSSAPSASRTNEDLKQPQYSIGDECQASIVADARHRTKSTISRLCAAAQHGMHDGYEDELRCILL